MAANASTRKACHSSSAGRTLSRIFSCLQINNMLSPTGAHITGDDNVLANKISRTSHTHGSAPSFSHLLQDFPQLASCCQFHLSQEMLSYLLHALLKERNPGLSVPKNKGTLDSRQ